ncbi:MAG: hypothetical protein FJX42_06405 [Alphaproteobacteria bacterium]|nr:hypothetical protein [Alphaproteobacteria bacterium]
MAISRVTYSAIRAATQANVFPRGGSILELGEANWYGDLHPKILLDDVKVFVSDPVIRASAERQLNAIVRSVEETKSITEEEAFQLAKLFYRFEGTALYARLIGGWIGLQFLQMLLCEARGHARHH